MKLPRLAIFLILLSFSGCLIYFPNSKKTIVITQDYLLNPHFDEYNNFFGLQRLIYTGNKEKEILDSIININFPIDDFEVDTNFCYEVYLKPESDEWGSRKIWFNSFNGFLWGGKWPSEKADSTIGKLNRNSWYRFSNLYVISDYSVVIHINQNGEIFKFFINQSNW
jgi:hypothetical protein